MNTQGHLRDTPLPALFKSLADQAVSGCLRIEFQPEPALFYFRKGWLVDARMAYLNGFAAVHVAISRPDAAFSFDGEILPPHECAINDESERLMLTRVLGIRVGSETVAASARPDSQPVTPLKVNPVEAGIAEATQQVAELNSPLSPDLTVPAQATAQLMTAVAEERLSEPVRNAFRKVVGSHIKRLIVSQQALKYLTRQKLLRAAAAIFVIAVPAAVGLTVRLTKKGPETPALAAVQQPALVQPADTSSSHVKNSVAENKLPAVAPAVTTPHPEASHTLAPEKNIKTVTKEVSSEPKVIDEAPAAQPKEQPKNTETSNQPERNAGSGSKTIMVVVRIEDGHVSEAWVKDSRKGLEAYEATAVRLVRQRRYSKEVTRTETVPVSVTINK